MVPFVLAVSHVCVGNITSLDEDVKGGLHSLSLVNSWMKNTH